MEAMNKVRQRKVIKCKGNKQTIRWEPRVSLKQQASHASFEDIAFSLFLEGYSVVK
jgi:hypothetical protein